MAIRKRQSNRPDRRVVDPTLVDEAITGALAARLRYVGSANHKLHPGNYGFTPPQNPRPSKSPCDALRPVRFDEAATLFRRGIELGMISPVAAGGAPKYVWSVDDEEQVYEAKSMVMAAGDITAIAFRTMIGQCGATY
jgi:hypothetical protein